MISFIINAIIVFSAKEIIGIILNFKMDELFADPQQLDEIAGFVFMGADLDGNGFLDSSEILTYSTKIGKLWNNSFS